MRDHIRIVIAGVTLLAGTAGATSPVAERGVAFQAAARWAGAHFEASESQLPADAISLSDAGHLEIDCPVGRVIQHKPVVYQEVEGERELIDGRYVLKVTRGVGLVLGTFDRNPPLVIDPIVPVEIRKP